MACEVLLKAGTNLFSLMCKLLQLKKISSDQFKNIMINTLTDDIVMDCRIKTCNGWVAGVNFLQVSNNKRAVSAIALSKKNINNLHVELGHPSEAITRSTAEAFSI